jgi:dolichol-phosphate mannosyltransferase
MLYLGQEHLFAAIRSSGTRLNISLGLAIFCATVNNFGWNRGWTWGDRRQIKTRPLLQQFGQYALACWLGILLQALFTKVLTAHCHYLIANVVAIGLAGIFNFTVNDLWTFAGLKRWFPVREGKAGPNVPEDADV